MKRYHVKAVYKCERTMTVTVREGADPLDPANWEEIEAEDEQDCYLYDTRSATEAED